MFGATVTIRDELAPVVGVPAGTLFAGGWLRGTKTAQITGSDSTGIDRLQLRRNGVPVATDTRTCDFTRPAPCASPGQDVTSQWQPINTAEWPDGTHTVVAAVRDAGQNEGTAMATVKTDNTAPIAPLSAGPPDGVLWANTSSRAIEWGPPAGQASPIVAANVTLCTGPGGACAAITPETPSRSIAAFPQPGLYKGTVWLTDEAGNGSPANTAELKVGFDPSGGPAPHLGTPAYDGSRKFVVPVNATGDPGPAPLEGLEGQVCTADGAACESFFQLPTDQVTVGVPGPGSWKLRVHTIDLAGNRGADAETMLTVGGATPTPTATTTPRPTRTPTPTPTADPNGKDKPDLRVTNAALRRTKLVLRGELARRATGRISVRVLVRRGKRRALLRKQTPARFGRFKAKIRLPEDYQGMLRAQLKVTYGGDRSYRAQALTRTVQR